MNCWILCLAAFVTCVEARECDITKFGAKGDGKTLDTIPIMQAISRCADSGGGSVRLPSPGRYLSAPFNLSSNIHFVVESGAELLATENEDLWPVLPPLVSYGAGRENDGNMTGRYAAFIGGEHLQNVTISGGGVINGQGTIWWFRSGRLPLHQKTIKHTRGRLIQLAFCKDFTVRDVTLKDSPFWTLHPYACDGVLVERVTIEAPVWSRNTDCIDPDSSTNVLIRNCSLSGGDDQIAIKSGMDSPGRTFGRPAANITIEDIIIGHGDGISIGSEMSGGVHNVTVRRVKMRDVLHPLRIKSGYGRGGTVSQILFEDIELAHLGEATGTAITVDEFDSNIDPSGANHTREGWPTIHDVEFRNIRGGSLKAGTFRCIDEVPCQNIRLINVSLFSVEGFDCSKVTGTAADVTPKPCLGESSVDDSLLV